MPLSTNCHGTAMTPTAIHKVAMGVAVAASGSDFVPVTVSFAIEDQRDEAPHLALARAKGLNPIASNPSAVPVAGLLPPKAGPVVFVTQVAKPKFRDSAGTVAREVAAFATTYPGMQVVRSGALGSRIADVGSRPQALRQLRGMR